MVSKHYTTLLIFLGAIFFLLELVFWKPVFLIWLLPLIFLFNLFYTYKVFGKWRLLVLPSLNLLGAFLFIPLVSLTLFSHPLIILVSFIHLLIYINLIKWLEEKGLNLNLNYILGFSVFFIFNSGLFALSLSFDLNPYLVVLGVVFASYFLSFELFKGIDIKLIYRFLVLLILAESSWAIMFFPFSYLTQGAILLIIYYTLWELIKKLSANKLNWKAILKIVFIFVFFLGVILASTPWLPR